MTLEISGTGTSAPPPLVAVSPAFLTMLTCLDRADPGDELVRAIRADLTGKSSLLELVKEYVTQLEGSVDNDAQVLRKLRKLFALGRVPDRMDGHHDGVTLGLRTGDLGGKAAEHGKYRYGLYEYFVLMDQEWQAERLRIGFDLDNA